jgi:hypothetical protein
MTKAEQFSKAALAIERGEFERARSILEAVEVLDWEPQSRALKSWLLGRLGTDLLDAPPGHGPRRHEPKAVPRQRSRTDAPMSTRWMEGPLRAPIESLVKADDHEPLPGISVVSACMNREGNLLKVLPSWLAAPVDEIVIVDWSSHEPLWPQLARFRDPRLRVVRIDDEPRWVLTHAFNLGLRLARHERVYKLDADIQVAPDFFESNHLAPGEFVRGFWKAALDAGAQDQVFVNGSFGAMKADLREVGYYDERILTYGWDDSDLYMRLSSALGLAGRLLALGSLRHLEQVDEQRIANQSIARNLRYGHFAPTEHENIVNRFHTATHFEWSSKLAAQDYRIEPQEANLLLAQRLGERPSYPKAQRVLAETLAARLIVSWLEPVLPNGAGHPPADSLELGRLVRQADNRGQSPQLMDGLRQRRNVHLLRVDSPEWRQAVHHTLDTLKSRHAALDRALIVLEDEGYRPEAPGEGDPTRGLQASAPLMDAIERAVEPRARTDLHALSQVILAGTGPCTTWRFDAPTLASAARTLAGALRDSRPSLSAPSAGVRPSTALITSLHDEPDLLRLVEVLACIEIHLALFEFIVIVYEHRAGPALQSLHALLAHHPEVTRRLTLVPSKQRPDAHSLLAQQHRFGRGQRVAVTGPGIVLGGALPPDVDKLDPGQVGVLRPAPFAMASSINLYVPAPNVGTATASTSETAWVFRVPLSAQDGLLKFLPIDADDVLSLRVVDGEVAASAAATPDDREPGPAASGTPDRGVGCDTLVINRAENPPDLGTLIWLWLLGRWIQRATPTGRVVGRFRKQDLDGPFGRLLERVKPSQRLQLQEGCPAQGGPDTEAGRDTGPRLDGSSWLGALAESGLDGLAAAVEASLSAAGRQAVSSPGHPGAVVEFARDTFATQSLIATLNRIGGADWAQLRRELTDLPAHQPEGRLVAPFLPDLLPPSPMVRRATPQVAFVTSMFRGGIHTRGYLENVAAAAEQVDGEVVIVDANGPGQDGDSETIQAFLAEHPGLRRRISVLRPPRDPGLYTCWQLAIQQSRAPLITNANLDDRRSPVHTLRLAALLQSRLDLEAVCGALTVVGHDEQGGWFDLLPNQVWFGEPGLREFGYDELFRRADDGTIYSQNLLHCMPLWRRRLHDRFGWFDEDRYGTSADWAFWLQAGRAGARFALDPQAWGRYFFNPDSHNRRNDADGAKERRIIAELIGVAQDRIIKQ